MSTRKVVPYEGSDFDEDLQAQLTNPEFASSYINAVIDDSDPEYFKTALSRVVRAYGFSEVAEKSGIGRETLYKMLSENGNPSFVNVVKILKACGLDYGLRPAGVPLFPEPMLARYTGKIADAKTVNMRSRVDESSKVYQSLGVPHTAGKKKLDEYFVKVGSGRVVAKKATKKTTKKVATKKVATKKMSTKKHSVII